MIARRARVVRTSRASRDARREAEWHAQQRLLVLMLDAMGLPLMAWQRELLARILRPQTKGTHR